MVSELSIGAHAMRFAVLTACRTGEVIGAQWSEIDLTGRVWTIPAERMKADKPHRVPLTDAMLDVLAGVGRYKLAMSPFVFPGERHGKPISNMTMLNILRKRDLPFTVHGFRSSFRDWCAEETNYSPDVCEVALAHTVKGAVERAYRRTDFFDLRAKLMADWSSVCTSPAVALALPDAIAGRAKRVPRVKAMTGSAVAKEAIRLEKQRLKDRRRAERNKGRIG
jgi:integrase